MLIYNKVVNGKNRIYGTFGNVASEADAEIKIRDLDGTELSLDEFDVYDEEGHVKTGEELANVIKLVYNKVNIDSTDSSIKYKQYNIFGTKTALPEVPENNLSILIKDAEGNYVVALGIDESGNITETVTITFKLPEEVKDGIVLTALANGEEKTLTPITVIDGFANTGFTAKKGARVTFKISSVKEGTADKYVVSVGTVTGTVDAGVTNKTIKAKNGVYTADVSQNIVISIPCGISQL